MRILITGATGNIGRRLVASLARQEDVTVRALTRDPAKAAFPAGVEVVQGDLARPETLDDVFDGVDRMFLFPLAYHTPEVFSLDQVSVTTDIPGLAAKAGVGRIVLLSSNAVMYGQDEHHQAAEQSVVDSGVENVILRPGEFANNKIMSWATSIRDEGVVRSGFSDVVGVPIHEGDIADVAAATLLAAGTVDGPLELTGPERLTEREQVAAVAAGLGRPIALEELTPERAREVWIGQGIPTELVDEIAEHYRHFAEHPPSVSPDVAKVTGSAGRTLAAWASEHRADFR